MSEYLYFIFITGMTFKIMVDPRKLTDPELYRKCKEYGGNARMWIRKFAGLLPEVFRRKLYKRRGYAGINEFAAKLAGMNHDTVNRILRLHEKLKDKPVLRAQLESGEVGWSKLEIVASLATTETDESLSEKTKLLPKPALQEYVKQNQPLDMVKTFAGEAFESQKIIVSMPLQPKTKSRLELLKQKIQKEKKITMSWDEIMTEFINGYQNPKKTKPQKIVITNVCPKCVKRKADEREIIRPSRHIPADVKRIVDERSKEICEYPLCLRPAVTYHHTRRFALRPNHDPAFLVRLCGIHNSLAHATLIEHESSKPERWKLRKERDRDTSKYEIDRRMTIARNFQI